MSTIRIAILTILFLLVAILTDQPARAVIFNAETQVSCTDGSSEIPVLECEALVAFYESTNGPDWSNNTGWLTSDTPCSWYGVTCTGEHVTELRLEGERR